MTESEAFKLGNKLYANITSNANNIIKTNDYIEFVRIAINALEKQKKIKEAFEMWKAETDGYYGADDETTRFISTLSQILRSDEEYE